MVEIMKRLPRTFGLLAGASFLAGCAVEALPAVDPDGTAVAEEELSTDNALSANALNANALYANALSANALNANALNANALSSASLAAIQDPGSAGALSRQLLKYTVSCALGSSQSFTFSWTDSGNVVHTENYPGSLGIEPSWATQPLGDAGKQMVSACLISRVNYYGVQVIISARSMTSPLTTVGSSELQAYQHIEGAFWGNLFSPTPYAFSCYNESNVSISRGGMRDCATGHVNTDGTVSSCGIINRVGGCQSVCPKIDGAGQYYQSCVAQPGVSDTSTGYVITTALP
jgi:hypothetical protein